MNAEDIYRPPQADMEAPVERPPGEPVALAPFFQTSLLKVGLLSVLTFGLYQLTWFYRQWDRRKDHGEDVSPLARTLFAVFFVYGLFKSVNEEIDLRADLANAQRAPGSAPSSGPPIGHIQAGLLAVLFIGLSVASSVANRSGTPMLGLVSALFSWIPLVIVQKKINDLHASLGYDASEGGAFTAGSFVAVAIGGLWWLLILIGLAARGVAVR